MSRTPGTAPGRRVVAAAAAAVVAAAVLVGLLVVRKHSAEAREADARRRVADAGAPVRVVTVEMGSATRPVFVTGEVRAFRQVTLYAKLSGYVTRMHVDKGDRVREGQVLAVLESPEAKEQLASAEADLVLKQRDANRARALAPSHVISDQEVDQATSALEVAQASVGRAKANLDYATLRAPFSGRITARYVDEGALVAAATGSTSSVQPLLDLAEMDVVRVLAYLPQDDALAAKEGDAAVLQVGGGEELHARVTRISRSLDPRTRTMLVEIDVRNEPPRIYPGQFVPLRVLVGRPARPAVPPAALVFRGDATFVARVDDRRIRLVPVKVGEHDGPLVQVVAGLRGGETVALDAGGLADGAAVQPRQAAP